MTSASAAGLDERGAFALLGRLCVVVAAVSLAGMASVQGWQVFARYVLNNSPSWTEPVALLFMNFAMMFGAAAGVRSGSHFGFFLLPQSCRGLAQRLLTSLSHLLSAGIMTLLSIWAARLVADGWDVPIAGAPLPQGLQYLPLAIAGALMAVFALERFWRAQRSASGAT
jgi:TRAP-type C4-dicarboxylate transport system permease small subunit